MFTKPADAETLNKNTIKDPKDLKLMVAQALQRKQNDAQDRQSTPITTVPEYLLKKLLDLAQKNEGSDLTFAVLQYLVLDYNSSTPDEKIMDYIASLIEYGILIPFLLTTDANDSPINPTSILLSEKNGCIINTQNVLTGKELATYPQSDKPVPIERTYISFKICQDWKQKLKKRLPKDPSRTSIGDAICATFCFILTVSGAVISLTILCLILWSIPILALYLKTLL